MIYLIGGPFRVGKTTVSKRIFKEQGIPYIPTDLLRNSLYNGFLGREIPQKWADRPAEFFPYLSDFIKRCENKYPDGVVIEGDIFLPEQIAQIKNVNIKCVFIGASQISIENLVNDDPTNWINDKSDEVKKQLVKTIIDISTIMKEQCEKSGFQYFDIYPDREATLNATYNYLLS